MNKLRVSHNGHNLLSGGR